MPPAELARALMIEGICQRYHCLPSQALAEDADTLRHMEIMRLYEVAKGRDGQDGWDEWAAEE